VEGVLQYPTQTEVLIFDLNNIKVDIRLLQLKTAQVKVQKYFCSGQLLNYITVTVKEPMWHPDRNHFNMNPSYQPINPNQAFPKVVTILHQKFIYSSESTITDFKKSTK
jgi:hypothetical protein